MAIEIGSIMEGKVTGITKFGAFVELPGGTTGMVHISEVASTFVKEISDYLKMGDIVKVKVININEQGKVGLSIKKAQPQAAQPERSERPERRPRPDQGAARGGKPAQPEVSSFESMLNKFKQTSDEKMYEMKRFMDNKRPGGGPRRGGSGGNSK